MWGAFSQHDNSPGTGLLFACVQALRAALLEMLAAVHWTTLRGTERHLCRRPAGRAGRIVHRAITPWTTTEAPASFPARFSEVLRAIDRAAFRRLERHLCWCPAL